MVVSVLATARTVASTIGYTYAYKSDVLYWATSKAENYDIAIRIADPFLVGKQITGLSVPFPSSVNVTAFSGWLSKTLNLEKNALGKKVNAPDVVTVSGELQDNVLNITFPEPYTITEEGVYAGYSFSVTTVDADNPPVAVSAETSPDGFYVHTSRTYLSWQAKSETLGAVLAMKVWVSGDFGDNSAGIASVNTGHVRAGEDGVLQFVLANHGAAPVTSIDYIYEVDGQQTTGHADITPAIEATYGKSRNVEIPIRPIQEKGTYQLTLALSKVNGQDNEEQAVASADYWVHTFLPKKRPVIEEYTGTWCGYCPRGFAGLEQMKLLHPDDFIGISYHNGDPMTVMSSSLYPSNVSGFPAAWLDRERQTDAYCGDGAYYTFGIEQTWEEQAARFTDADVSLIANWSGDDPTVIEVTASVAFAADLSGLDYRLAYILLADDLHGDDTWGQSNYYSGDTNWSGMPGMDEFVNGESLVTGLHYNDVIIARSAADGIEGSLPSDVKEGTPYSHTYRIDTSSAVSIYNVNIGESLVQDRGKLRVVALVINAADGTIVNANKADVGNVEYTGIQATSALQTAATVYYDLSGRRVEQPGNGIYIRQTILPDGSGHREKVICR